MTNSPLPLAPEAFAALSGFLREIERRAAVLSELLCGDAVLGDEAVASAMLGLRNAAAQRPLVDWETQFWRLLLATPQLRTRHPNARSAPPLGLLPAQGAGMRALLLLRLLGGLDEAQAAAALCVTPHVFARASRLAKLDAGAGAAHHAALAASLQQRLRQLSAARLVRLAASRERALRGVRLAAAPRKQAWRRPALGAGVIACALALAATFLFDSSGGGGRGAKPRPLPAAAPALATFDADFALMTRRDFEQLANPGDSGFQRDLGFYAWYAARTAPATDAPGVSLQGVPPELAAGTAHGAR